MIFAEVMKTEFFLFTILILGSISLFSSVFATEYAQICIDKVWIEKTNHKIACVTPSTADKLVERGWGTILADDTFEAKPAMKELEVGQEIIETRIGTLELQSDYLTPETAKTLKDELFFQRAIQVYQLALPAVAGAGIFYEADQVGAQYGDVMYWSDFMTSDIELLTGNTSVLYFFSYQDLSDGPIVVEVPAGSLQGHIDNIYQQVITDIGGTGPYAGDGGTILILPPNYDGEIPENYFVEESDTIQFMVVGRAFVNAPDMVAAEDLITNVSIYNLSEVENPPKEIFLI